MTELNNQYPPFPGTQPTQPRWEWSFITVGIVLAILVAWGGGYFQATDRAMRNGQPASKIIFSKRLLINQCNRLPESRRAECIFNAVSKIREDVRAEQQLSADQRSSFSALFSAIFSVLAVGISIVGVIFVKRTFQTTLSALEVTSTSVDAMHSQNRLSLIAQRPWLSISRATCKVLMMPEQNVAFAVQYDLQNFGSTPAISVFPLVEVFEDIRRSPAGAPPIDHSVVGGAVIFPSEIRHEGNDTSAQGWHRDPMPTAIASSIRITVTYQSTHTGERMYTVMNFKVGAKGSNENTMRLVNLSDIPEYPFGMLEVSLVPDSRFDMIG